MTNNLRPQRRPPTPELDDVDRQILQILATEARIPNNALASRVQVAPSTCLMRVRRLVDTGVIRGFHAELAPAALGRPLQALIAVRLAAASRQKIGAFARQMASLDGVLNVFFLGGANDFQIHIAAETPDSLRDFVVKHLSASRDVAMTETNLIFEHLVAGTALIDPVASD